MLPFLLQGLVMAEEILTVKAQVGVLPIDTLPSLVSTLTPLPGNSLKGGGHIWTSSCFCPHSLSLYTLVFLTFPHQLYVYSNTLSSHSIQRVILLHQQHILLVILPSPTLSSYPPVISGCCSSLSPLFHNSFLLPYQAYQIFHTHFHYPHHPFCSHHRHLSHKLSPVLVSQA